MGLFNRLRSSSTAASQHPRPGPGPDDLAPPPPLPALVSSTSRLSTQGDPGSGSVSRPFWKRKGKSKDKEKDVPGFSYESTAPAPSALASAHSQQQARAPQPHTWGRAEGYAYEEERRAQLYQARAEPRIDRAQAPKGILQDRNRGMLGRLDFETSDQSASGSGSGNTTDDERALPLAQVQQPHPQSHAHPAQNHTDTGTTTPTRRHFERDMSSARAPRISQEEQERMEHLVSPEKKQQQQTPRARRMSRSEEPVSPTPRKSSLPPQDLPTPTATTKAPSSDGHQSQQQRRPSASRRSSFIPLGNPFARSTTRLSLDAQPAVDDGSFQLRGFRHVSGASEADFAWEAYNGVHTQQHASGRPVVDTTTAAATSPVAAGTLVTSPTATTTAPPSRPVSRATSLASMDDHIAASTKVSAAAFRKGIRRQSLAGGDSDEDDVPLGLLRPGMGRRDSSALSLSSMRDPSASAPRTPGSAGGTKTPPRPAQQHQQRLPASLPTSPSNTKAIPVPTHRLQPTRSRTTPLISPDEIHPMFSSPAGSPVITPSRVVEEPTEESYFPTSASAVAVASPPSPAKQKQAPLDSPVLDIASLDYPVDAFSTSPQSVKITSRGGPPIGLAPPVDIVPPVNSHTEVPTTLSISVPEPKSAPATATAAAETNDEIDSDLVIRSMAMYADGDGEGEDEPQTPRMALHQQSHSTLFGTDASSDTTSTLRSPLSERLGNLVGPRPMSSKPSLPKLDTLKFGAGADSSERSMRSPAASDSTVSPTVSTIRGHQPLVSGISRGTAVSPVPSASESSSSEDEDEEEVEPPKRPAGPPRSSFANAPRPRIPPPNRPSTSVQPVKKDHGSSNDESSDDDDDDDKPLARIRSKASRSTLAVNETIARPATMHDALNAAVPAPVPAPNVHARSASVPAIMASPVVQPRPLVSAHSPTKPIWNASPASSQSGLTGDSSAAQPVTPSEHDISEGSAAGSAFKSAAAGPVSQDTKRASVSWAQPQHRQRRGSNYSVATAPPTSAALSQTHHQAQAQAPPVPPLPSGMDPLMRQRMKEMWQAQYMAAASRAFEDEWERQSTASGPTAPSVASPSMYQGYAPQAQQQQQYPMPIPPMGYGWPPHPHQQPQYMYPGAAPSPGGAWGMPMPMSPQHEPAMYAYGSGAQSVYGGEFGPPQPQPQMPLSPYGMGMGMGGLPGSYSTTNLHSPAQQRPGLPTSRSTSYFSAPTKQPPQHQHQHRRSEVDLDYTPPKGLINSVPNSPRGAQNRRSALGTSVISANDRSASAAGGPPPTSWRRSSAMPLLNWEEEEAAALARTPKQQRRQSRQLVN